MAAIALGGLTLLADATTLPGASAGTPSCVDDGARVCAPGNAAHVPAGCYDDGGVLFAAWPCTAWKPSDGYWHGDGTWSAS